jgi:hypothetical protein
MASFNKFNSFVEALAEKKHNLGSDTLKVTFCAAAAAPEAADAVLGDLTLCTGNTNWDSQTLTISTSAQSGGTYKLVIADKTMTASDTVGPFRYVVVYNDTAATDELIGWYDYGSEITLSTSETLDLDFDGSNGMLSLV